MKLGVKNGDFIIIKGMGKRIGGIVVDVNDDYSESVLTIIKAIKLSPKSRLRKRGVFSKVKGIIVK